MKDKIKSFCKKLNIEYTGFTKVDGKTAVVCLFPYYTEKVENSNISVYTYSEDYHLIIKKYLLIIAEFIKANFGFDSTAYVDISPYNDVLLAYNAGLGVIGKNNLLINEKYGSFVFIGYLITELEAETDTPIKSSCLECGNCIKSCPSGTLKNGNYEICLSHITQKKAALTAFETELIRKNRAVFGCDVCQLVCPMNKFTKTPISEFYDNHITNLEKKQFDNLSNKQFKEQYGNRAFSWRGKNVLVRNLEIISEED